MPEAMSENLTASLETTLKQLVGLHGELLELLKRKRELVRTNDSGAMTGLCVLEHEKLQKIAELEKRRLNTAASLTLRFEPRASEPMKLAALASCMSEPERGRLLVLRQQLLDGMVRVRDETHVVQRATETLAKHMHGIVQTLGALSAGIATYGSRGSLPERNTAVSTFSATA